MSNGHLLGQIRDSLDNRGSYFSKFATLDGSGVTFNAIGTLSGVTESFIISADAGPLKVARMIVTVQDGAGFDAGDYGAVAGGLANGITVRQEDATGAVVANIVDPLAPIKTNVDWAAYCYDGILSAFGTGDNFYNARWTFSKAGLPLRLPQGGKIRIILHDTLTGLSGHRFLFQGRQT